MKVDEFLCFLDVTFYQYLVVYIKREDEQIRVNNFHTQSICMNCNDTEK